MSHLRMTENG